MILTVKEPIKIEDGLHEGVITAIEHRFKPYPYTDLVIEFEEGKRLKVDFPTSITRVSRLGNAIRKFGVILEIGDQIDLKEVFIGKKCNFVTIKDGQFSNIIPESLKEIK